MRKHMRKKISLAPNLTDLLKSTGELAGVEQVIPSGLSGCIDGVAVRVYKSSILLNKKDGKGNNTGEQETGEFVCYRYANLRLGLYKLEYKEALMPFSYRERYPEERVHLIYIKGEGRKDKFTDISFP